MGSFDCRKERNMSIVVSSILIKDEVKIRTFIRKVIAQAENKFRCISRLIAVSHNESLRDLALVDEARTNF